MKIKGKATLLTVRAIGALYGKRIWFGVTLTAAALSLVLIALCIWLISLSGWWWILAILVGMALSIASVVLAVFRMVLRSITPAQDQAQKAAVKAFVEKLDFVKELTATPKVVILFRLIRSVAAPSSEKYLEDIFASRTLKDDFLKVVALFN